jgi:hypothetical protein
MWNLKCLPSETVKIWPNFGFTEQKGEVPLKDRQQISVTGGVCSRKIPSHIPGWSIARQEFSVRHKSRLPDFQRFTEQATKQDVRPKIGEG